MRSSCSLYVRARVCAGVFSLSQLVNGSVKIPFPLLGNGSVETLPR
jgi:hypothetical protein